MTDERPNDRDTINRLERENAWLRERLRWRPIESAQRDGTAILVLYDGNRYIARWGSVFHPDNQMWVVDIPLSAAKTVQQLGPEIMMDGTPAPFGRTGPTHWLPLPEAPEASDG